MALLSRRCCLLFLLLCFTRLTAQTVYYPAGASDELILTAKDVAALFNRALPGNNFTTQSYTTLPSTGIVFQYDSAFINNQWCRIESNGSNYLKFSAAQDVGLCYGVYSYLDELGFRFYLPGKLWEKIPALNAVFLRQDRVLKQPFRYNNWFISGGYNRWAMDREDPYGGNFGLNGHDWRQYQLRNNMTGAYRFTGHRGDIYTPEYISQLSNNPCYIACYNGERKANALAVPDINNNNAKDLWASTLLQRYTYYKSIVASAPLLYRNFYRNFNYDNAFIGIEVPDGGAFGNSSDNSGCTTGNFDGDPYPNISDQQFLLANATASRINQSPEQKYFQCYAYSSHANIPSPGIGLNKNIDVQVVASAFQSETSTLTLLDRWYKKHTNVSEYDYFNIPQWSGETPVFSLANYQNTLLRLKEKKSQGIVIEASPAKFASLPYLFAGNRYLQHDTPLAQSLDTFINDMFPGPVEAPVKKLLNDWGNGLIMNGGDFMSDNKFKLPLLLQELNGAVKAAAGAAPEVKARLQELKAYLHYVVLYYELISDDRAWALKTDKTGAVCTYLARVNSLQLVNAYFLILDLVNKFPPGSDFYSQYNVTNGTAYLDGKLPAISDAEIDRNFSADMARYAGLIDTYQFEDAVSIISKMPAHGLRAMDKIEVGVGYNSGYENPGRCEFYFYAARPGSISLQCFPTFEQKNGFINISAESVSGPLLVIKDETVTKNNLPATIDITLPATGVYRLSVVSKYRSYANLIISTHGNTFFKGAPFYGKRAENYYTGNFKSLPKYFYVPSMKDVYFSINNGCYTGRCLTGSFVAQAFGLKDNHGSVPPVEPVAAEPLLYRMRSENAEGFWQVNSMREYNFCLANISNIELFAEAAPEAAPLAVLPEAITAYPNPSKGLVNFTRNGHAVIFSSLYVYDLQGSRVAALYNTGSIDMSRFSAGMYLYSAQWQGTTLRGKLVRL